MASTLAVCAAALLLQGVSASPAPTQVQARAVHPMITAPPTLVQRDPTKTYKHRRDIIDDLASDVGGILSGLGSGIPSFVASGVGWVLSSVVRLTL